MPRMTATDAADLIFDAWCEAGDGGMTQASTLDEAGLTPSQFGNGKEWLRDNLCLDKVMPFTFNPSTNRYYLNLESEQVEEYFLYRLRITAKQLRRLLDGTGGPAKIKFKGNRKMLRLFRNTDNILEDINDILEGVV